MSMLHTTIMFHEVRLLTSSFIYLCCITYPHNTVGLVRTQHWEFTKWKIHLLAEPRLHDNFLLNTNLHY
jgi:hypothetical protein